MPSHQLDQLKRHIQFDSICVEKKHNIDSRGNFARPLFTASTHFGPTSFTN